MAGFRFDIFRGIRPRLSKRKLPEGESQTAENIKFGSADIVPFKEDTTVLSTDDPYSTVSIYLYDDFKNGLLYWFQWPNYVDVALGPIKGDSLNRIYYTGDGSPKVTWNELQTAPPFPSQAYELGVPKPLSRLEAVGQGLPEDKAAAERRTSSAVGERPLTTSFEIAKVDFSTYPGTGTPNDTWRGVAQVGIVFDVDIGDTFVVEDVLDNNTLTLASTTGTGAVAATFKNDTSSGNYYQAMDEQGSTQLANFIGWRIPDGLRVTINDHRLRSGDVIRVTRLDLSYGMAFNLANTVDMFELASDGTAGDWGVPSLEVGGGYVHENVRIGASADGTSTFEVLGGFYYDVDRTSSTTDTLEDRTYVYTFVSAIGEEGPPSDPSSIVQALDGDSVTLTGFDVVPTGARDINRIRIYRTNATAVGTEYQFVREVTINQINADGGLVVDNVANAALENLIQTTTWFPPPADMIGIVSMPNGIMVGFKEKDIFFSEPYQPHAWPPEYDQAVDYEIVGLAPFGNSVAVMTTGNPYVISGSHPRNMNIRPYKINQACLNKESIATSRDRVFYASPDGLVEVGVNGARVATEAFARKEDWAAFEPDSMVGEFHDGQYYGFWGADDTVIPQPTGSVAATGTLVTDDETFEKDIIDGGKTIILTLTNDTWVAAGNTFDAVRSDIVNAITSNASESGGWNVTRATVPVTDVVRTSDTVVTITLSALPTYSITDLEVLTYKAPAIAITGSFTLTAPEKSAINQDSFYSSQIVVTTTASTSAPDADKPEVLISDENVEVWSRQNSPGDLDTTFEIDIEDAAYHKTLERWAWIGYNTASSPTTTRIYTNDKISNADDWVFRSSPLGIAGKAARTIIYDDTTDAFWVGGDDGAITWSQNGINWYGANMPSTATTLDLIGFARAPQGGDGTSPYLYAIGSNSKTVVRSKNLLTSPMNSTWEDIGTATTTGTGMAAIASGDGLVFVANNHTAAEVGFFVQGGTSYTKIGDLATECADMVFGNNRLVTITDNGRIRYADAPDETNIANWSTLSAALDGAGTRDKARLDFDDGDGIKPGYGFVATLSASGAEGDYVVYTSPDAVTWTLRQTVSNTSDARGIGVAYPETDLEGQAANALVSVTGFTYYQYGDILEGFPTVKLIVREDGTIDTQRDNRTPIQKNSATDWIVPNWFKDPLYEVRVTNVVTLEGSGGFTSSPIADGSWIAISADRTWTVAGKVLRFTLEIRYNGGAVLDSAQITLGSKQYQYWRDDEFDFDDRYWYVRR